MEKFNIILLLIFYGIITLAICIIYYYHKIIINKKPKNRVHFYVARDKDHTLYVYLDKPERSDFVFMPYKDGTCLLGDISCFQKYGLNSDDFKDLKWEDEPVEVFLNLED